MNASGEAIVRGAPFRAVSQAAAGSGPSPRLSHSHAPRWALARARCQGPLMRFYKVVPTNLLVIYDDLDLDVRVSCLLLRPHRTQQRFPSC